MPLPRTAIVGPPISNRRGLTERMLLAILSLALGGFTYLLIRTPIYPLIDGLHETFALGYIDSLRAVTGSVPTLCHTFSLVLFTSIFLPDSRTSYALNTASWIGMESILEVMQGPLLQYDRLTGLIADSILCGENCRGYFLSGTYDLLDILSIIVGGSLAYFCLTRLRQGRLCTHV